MKLLCCFFYTVVIPLWIVRNLARQRLASFIAPVENPRSTAGEVMTSTLGAVGPDTKDARHHRRKLVSGSCACPRTP